MKTWCVCIECWTPKATKTHSEYVILSLFTATMVPGIRLKVTLYVHCLFCNAVYIRLNMFSPTLHISNVMYSYIDSSVNAVYICLNMFSPTVHIMQCNVQLHCLFC